MDFNYKKPNYNSNSRVFSKDVLPYIRGGQDSDNNINNNCCKKTDNLIPVPVSSLTTVKEFVFNNTAKEPRNLEPVYKIPFPVVYRVYLDDGHCHCCL